MNIVILNVLQDLFHNNLTINLSVRNHRILIRFQLGDKSGRITISQN